MFIVHGRDEEVKETVARFLEKLGLHPIILHEHPNKGRTVIEKFEECAEVSFAVVLLTPDDEGGLKGSQMRARARQNVILELGYFLGRLGRGHVVAISKGDDLNIPSDYHGVLFTEFKPGGAGKWNWSGN